MKTRYKKTTFNLIGDNKFGTFVEKQIKVDGEWHTVERKNFFVHENPNYWDKVSAREMWFENYE